MGKIWMPGGGGGADLDVITAGASDVLVGKVIVDKDGEPLIGAMPNREAVSQSLGINGTYTIPAGYHNGAGKVTQNIATMGGQTINPTTSQQTVSSSGRYMTGNVVVNAVANLSAGNIKRGVVVGGVTGTWEGYVGGANDLYIRGANKAGFTGGSYIVFDTAQITIRYGDGGGGRVMTAPNVRFAGYSYLNIEGNFSGGYIQFTPGDISAMQVNVSGSGTWSFNLSAAQITGQCKIFFYNGGSACYRIWLS
ncbi:hypothetical protein ABFV83_02365 [Lacrimispora sp. BS-2]|uniref:Uncharacterized protein n=1 Tax=Lacrimispora sp. BS-2 TaxID=3151850 RepID=A0AAU7PR39_9FIRM